MRVNVIIAKGKTLPLRYKDHLLAGNYKGLRECYISPDCLLIYERKDVLKMVTLVRQVLIPICFSD